MLVKILENLDFRKTNLEISRFWLQILKISILVEIF